MKAAIEIISGAFQHLIYSPKGAIEGVLLLVDGTPAQIVFDKHDDAGMAFGALRTGQVIVVQGTAAGVSDKGPSAHAVYEFGKLITVDGQKPARGPKGSDAEYRGTLRGSTSRGMERPMASCSIRVTSFISSPTA